MPPTSKSRSKAKPKPSASSVTQGTHPEHEDYPWTIAVQDHPARTDTPEYVASRKKMNEIAAGVKGFYYGNAPYQDHHGGGLWLKDEQGWFVVKNTAGIEWSAQFCADPAKVDQLRLNARRLYAAFPDAVEQLGVRELLDTKIEDAAGIQRWTDSICNASVPLPATLHTGVLPKGGGVHHYPTPITDISLFKHDDFQLWVLDEEGQPAAVTPVAKRGSGNGHVQVVYSTPNTKLNQEHQAAEARGEQLILPPDHHLAKQAFRRQSGKQTRIA